MNALAKWLLMAVAVYASAALTLAAAAGRTPSPELILVSLDGYRADYLTRGHSPALAALAAAGVRAEALRPVFPSLTYPNHYTLVTGLYPDQHGIVNNSMHDPELGSFSPPNRAANADGRWWSEAEPIWVNAERHHIITAAEFWPGTQAQIRGIRPTYWQPFDGDVSADARVDQVLNWLDLPLERRPRFIMLYLEQADVAGHFYGPDSPELQAALVSIDAALARLIEALRHRGTLDSTNLVIVSDHGMSATSPERIVFLEYTRENFEATRQWTEAHDLFSGPPSAGYDQAALV